MYGCRQIFCDFGEKFVVNDVTGEQPISVIESSVTKVTTVARLCAALPIIAYACAIIITLCRISPTRSNKKQQYYKYCKNEFPRTWE